MENYVEIYVGVSFILAGFWALLGTNTQARLAKRAMVENEDERIGEAARAWRPGPRWVAPPKARRRRAAAEAALRDDPVLWARYERLRDELYAWNALESSVAAASVAAIAAFIMSL